MPYLLKHNIISAFKGVRAESLISERETVVSLSVYKGSSHIEMARKDYSSLEFFFLDLKKYIGRKATLRNKMHSHLFCTFIQ